MPDELLTVAEVAEELRLVPQTVRNMIDRGELPALRVGSRRVRIARADLDAFLGQRRRLSGRSERRVAYDGALETAAKALRSKDTALAARALRDLSDAALALADELSPT